MSSSGPLLILEGSTDPHWAWGFCSRWFFRDFSPSENKGIMFKILPFHQDVNCGLSSRTESELAPYMAHSGWHVWGWIMYNTAINCSFSMGDSNRGKECDILKWLTVWQLCVIDRCGTQGLISTSITFAVSEVAYAQDIVGILVVVLFNVWSLFWSVLELHGNLFQFFIQL